MTQDGDGLQADAIDRPGPPPELRDPPQRSRALGAFLATFALAAFAGVVWYAYDRGLQAGSEATAPLIQADPSPIKVRPEQPGGLDVPNQDKMVYGALRPDRNGGETVERLLPPPETPVEPPQPVTAPATQAPVSPATGDIEDRGGPAVASQPAAGGTATVPIPPRTPQPVPGAGSTATTVAAPDSTDSTEATAPPPPPPAPQPIDSSIPPARAPEPTPSPEPEPQVAVAPPPPPAPVPQAAPRPAPRPEPAVEAAPAPSPAPQPAATPPAGRFRVQLGAFRDEAAARREWDRLSRRYPDVLSGLALRIQQVDLGAGKGVFHRIQGGMLSEAAAEQACATLKSRNQACLLVRP